MEFRTNEVSIKVTNFAGDLCLYHSFHGKLTERSANEATTYWSSELEKQPFESYLFIWDCSRMTGFELSARKVWYDHMNRYKSQIRQVIVISGSIMIRSAAKVMLELFGVSSTVLKSKMELEELELEEYATL